MNTIKHSLLITIILGLISCAIRTELETVKSPQESDSEKPVLEATNEISDQRLKTEYSIQEPYPEKPEQQSVRTIIIGGEEFIESKPGQFNTWKCREYHGADTILIEFGTSLFPEDYQYSEFYNELDDATKGEFDDYAGMIGFILYEGTNSGDWAMHYRKGLNLRWDWGPNGEYSFIIKPDGTGLFYDFTTAINGSKEKADDLFDCSK